MPIDPFVVDCYCSAERLMVEVDGPIHASQRDADRQRQALLELLGLRLVRVTAAQVESDLAGVLDTIRATFGAGHRPDKPWLLCSLPAVGLHKKTVLNL